MQQAQPRGERSCNHNPVLTVLSDCTKDGRTLLSRSILTNCGGSWECRLNRAGLESIRVRLLRRLETPLLRGPCADIGHGR